MVVLCFFFKQKTAYEMRISDWSSDVCSSDLAVLGAAAVAIGAEIGAVAQELVDQIAVRGVELDTVEPGGKRVSRRPRVIIEQRSEEHTSELQSLMRISYAVFCLIKKKKQRSNTEYKST